MVDKREMERQKNLLTKEQEELLELYLIRLDEYYASLRESEKVQVEIETLHLKRILNK